MIPNIVAIFVLWATLRHSDRVSRTVGRINLTRCRSSGYDVQSGGVRSDQLVNRLVLGILISGATGCLGLDLRLKLIPRDAPLPADFAGGYLASRAPAQDRRGAHAKIRGGLANGQEGRRWPSMLLIRHDFPTLHNMKRYEAT